MKRWDIINHFIKKYSYSTYLEIGCQKDTAFNKVEIKNRIGVDPIQGGTHRMTSDEFFSMNKKGEKLTFDIIFVDGLHHSEQVYKDILNGLEILNKNGTIICHDMNPTSKLMQTVPRISREWTGDCWRAWMQLRTSRADLEMRVIDTDYGCGVIRKGKQKPLVVECGPCILKYDNFALNKKTWLPLINVEDFHKVY